jgi:hypothetical protein
MSAARVTETLARLVPLKRGEYEEAPGLVRYNWPTARSLAEDTPWLQHFFKSRFGRPLRSLTFRPAAAYDRMGFDHRNALDVAVHPDSVEGRALIEYLRGMGIPFVAARGPIAGPTSGAHIRVDPPSPRMTAGH